MVGGAMTFYMVAKAQAGMLTGKSPLFLTPPTLWRLLSLSRY